jgi:hypothetical protein
MGRARSGQQAVATGAFAALLGTRRGSPSAQAQRDAAERVGTQELLEAELDDFLAAVGRETNASPIVRGASAAELLVRSYRAQDPRATVVAALLSWMRANATFSRMEAFRELTFVVDRGDPPHAPGLTEPALGTLCDYFREGATEDPYPTAQYGQVTIKWLFGNRRRPETYLRLAPLCEALAPLISNPSDEGISSLGQTVAEALQAAPGAALVGPLRPWIDAYVLRIDSKRITPPEVRELRTVLAKHAPGSRSSACSAALAELSLRLVGN